MRKCMTIVAEAAVVLVCVSGVQAQVSPGDMNCDTVVNGLDVGAFVLALFNPSGYEATYPGCPADNADFDCDGSPDTGDILLFVECILNGDCDDCPPDGMVLIPSGEFEMGDHHDGTPAALPVHAVHVDSFYMDTYEVTNQRTRTPSIGHTDRG